MEANKQMLAGTMEQSQRSLNGTLQERLDSVVKSNKDLLRYGKHPNPIKLLFGSGSNHTKKGGIFAPRKEEPRYVLEGI